jgi:hypothetical protein
MRIWSAVMAVGLAVVAATLFLGHDLRGWTPADYSDPATIVEPSQAGRASFAIAECAPGTINPYDTPTSREYAGSATVTVLSCRSRSSATAVLLVYALVALTSFVILRVARRRPGGQP